MPRRMPPIATDDSHSVRCLVVPRSSVHRGSQPVPPPALVLAPSGVSLRLEPPLLRRAAGTGGAAGLRNVHQSPEGRPETLQGDRPVQRLAPPLRGGDRQSSRRVDEPDRGGGLVPVLAPGATGDEVVHLAVTQQGIVVLGQRRSGSFPPSALFDAVQGGSCPLGLLPRTPIPCSASASRAPAPTNWRASAASCPRAS